jgi:hypothetical protein
MDVEQTENVYIVDGAVFPYSKNYSFAMMANAYESQTK